MFKVSDMIKRLTITILIIYASAAFAETELYLTGSANTGYAHNPDLKSLLDDEENYYNKPSENTDKIQRKDADSQYGYSFEPRLFLDNIGFGLFIGKQYLSKGKLSAYSSTNGFWNETFDVETVNLGINFYYKLNLSRNKRYWIILGGGCTYFSAKIDISSYEKKISGESNLYKDSLKTTGFGAQARTEFHFSINQRKDSLFIGIEGKKCSKLRFKASYEDEFGVIQEEEIKISFSGVTLYGGLSFNIF